MSNQHDYNDFCAKQYIQLFYARVMSMCLIMYLLVGFGRACAPVRCAHPSFWLIYTPNGALRAPPDIAASLLLSSSHSPYTTKISSVSILFYSSNKTNVKRTKKVLLPLDHRGAKGTVVYYILRRVPQSLCCRVIWVPPLPFPENGSPLPSSFEGFFEGAWPGFFWSIWGQN
jgi:hypothetical protein